MGMRAYVYMTVWMGPKQCQSISVSVVASHMSRQPARQRLDGQPNSQKAKSTASWAASVSASKHLRSEKGVGDVLE